LEDQKHAFSQAPQEHGKSYQQVISVHVDNTFWMKAWAFAYTVDFSQSQVMV